MRQEKVAIFMDVAQKLGELSTCSRRQVGCLLLDSDGVGLSWGYNGVPRNFPHCTDVPCEGASLPSGTGLGKCAAIHAEQNAIAWCSDVRQIHYCFVTSSPCEHCLKMLMNTTCRELFFRQIYPGWKDDGDHRWTGDGRRWTLVAQPLTQKGKHHEERTTLSSRVIQRLPHWGMWRKGGGASSSRG